MRATSILTGRERVSSLEYQYASAISTLTQASTSPAAVRTLLAWCAYRTRQSVTPGHIEKGVLGAYRLIGYGERPMPAFVLYAVVAVVMTVIGLHTLPLDITLSGIGKFLREYVGWLISPIHVLSLTKSESGAPAFGGCPGTTSYGGLDGLTSRSRRSGSQPWLSRRGQCRTQADESEPPAADSARSHSAPGAPGGQGVAGSKSCHPDQTPIHHRT